MAGEGRIGTDESGKGDYFGPLVVAGVYVADGVTEERLRRLGARDSKKLSDRRVIAVAAGVKENAPAAVVAIGPARYNELYARMGNLNLILAWAHARVLENLAAEIPAATRAVTDKFGDESYVANALMKRGRKLALAQLHHAEDDVAVAAAACVARAEFLRRLERLGREVGVRLPKGAAAAVEEAAREIIRTRGAGALRAVAKVHFKTTSRLGLPAGAAL